MNFHFFEIDIQTLTPNDIVKMKLKHNCLKRKMTKSTSHIEVSSHDSLNEEKMKNILQTEFLVNLRQIILKIAHHFQTKDPKAYLNNCDLNADYSIESHSKDIDNYMKISTEPNLKRAKALVSFEITDDDELGFQKNDIITILSTKDDHCWIGELDSKKGKSYRQSIQNNLHHLLFFCPIKRLVP